MSPFPWVHYENTGLLMSKGPLRYEEVANFRRPEDAELVASIDLLLTYVKARANAGDSKAQEILRGVRYPSRPVLEALWLAFTFVVGLFYRKRR